MHSLRALILSLAAMAMIATGVAACKARGAMAADGQLCSVTGPAPVVLAHDGLPLFDTDGRPVTLDRAICIDCLIAAFDLPPAISGAIRPMALSTEVVPYAVSHWVPARAAPGGLARAPPQAG
jgi:hypothetical protein